MAFAFPCLHSVQREQAERIASLQSELTRVSDQAQTLQQQLQEVTKVGQSHKEKAAHDRSMLDLELKQARHEVRQRIYFTLF